MDVVWKVTVVKQRREFSEPDLEHLSVLSLDFGNTIIQ